MAGIKRILFDIETGGVDSNGESYEAIYQVIADHDFSSSEIYAYALDGSRGFTTKLPVYNDRHSTRDIPVSNVRIEPRDDNNFKGNRDLTPSTGKFLKVWDYTVTYSNAESGGSTTGDLETAPWSTNMATDYSLEPIYYTEYSNKTYKTTDSLGSPTGILFNALDEPIYRDRRIMNMILSFSYSVRTFNATWILSHVGSVNSKAMTICGVPIRANKARLESLVPSSQIYKNTNYFKVTVKMEIEAEKSVLINQILGTSFSFKYTDGIIYRTQRTSDPSKISNADKTRQPFYPGHIWQGYGCWGANALFTDPTGAYPSYKDINFAAENIEEPIVLDSTGSIFRGTPDFDSEGINIVSDRQTVPVDWSPLNFPTKGFAAKL